MKSKQVVRIAAHFLLDLSCVGEGEFPMTIRRCKRKKDCKTRLIAMAKALTYRTEGGQRPDTP